MRKFGLFFALLTTSVFSQNLSRKEKEILQLVDLNLQSSFVLLEKTVNINSGTFNLEGVRKVGRLFEEEFKNIGYSTQWIEMPVEMKRAGHLLAEHKGSKGKRLLFIGHLDTVFEPDSPFQSWAAHDTIATGPGAGDMKGGNIIMLFALKALVEAGVMKDSQIIVVLHGDEENGGEPKTISRKDIIEAAKRSDYALAFEGATGFGYATVARRGSSEWQLKVTGKRAHSSAIFTESVGSGAIYEASRILSEFYKQLQEPYLTFSPGMIVGGSTSEIDAGKGVATGKSNVVAETVIVNGDLRFISEDQKEKAREKMKKIVLEHLPGTSSIITFEDGIPSMPPTDGNYKLLEQLNKVSIDMGLGQVKPWNPGQRGAGDISYVAPYISGLDGLGAMGSGAHSLSEKVNLKTFRDLTARVALLIYRLTQ